MFKNIIVYPAKYFSKVHFLMLLIIGIALSPMFTPALVRAEEDCPYANQNQSDEKTFESPSVSDEAPVISASTIDSQLLELTNHERRLAGLSPLALSGSLGAAAQKHAQDMDEKNYFDHTGRDGSAPADRTQRMGYSGQMIGENIAAGGSTARDTMQQWMNSPGHRKNILNPDYQEIGFGYSRNGGGNYGHYWVQVFGSR